MSAPLLVFLSLSAAVVVLGAREGDVGLVYLGVIALIAGALLIRVRG